MTVVLSAVPRLSVLNLPILDRDSRRRSNSIAAYGQGTLRTMKVVPSCTCVVVTSLR
jgi:hypothetical protein